MRGRDASHEGKRSNHTGRINNRFY
jgi:hypothetical protein